MPSYLIPYDTEDERKFIITTLRAYDNSENRLDALPRMIVDSPFKSYKWRRMPQGQYCIFWNMENEMQERSLLLINNLLGIQSMAKRAVQMTFAMGGRLGTWSFLLL